MLRTSDVRHYGEIYDYWMTTEQGPINNGLYQCTTKQYEGKRS